MSKRHKRKTKQKKRLEQRWRREKSRYQRSEQGREDARKKSLRKRLRVPVGFLSLGMLIIGGLMLFNAPPTPHNYFLKESPQFVLGFLIFAAGLGGLTSAIWPALKNSPDDRPSEYPTNFNDDIRADQD